MEVFKHIQYYLLSCSRNSCFCLMCIISLGSCRFIYACIHQLSVGKILNFRRIPCKLCILCFFSIFETLSVSLQLARIFISLFLSGQDFSVELTNGHEASLLLSICRNDLGTKHDSLCVFCPVIPSLTHTL